MTTARDEVLARVRKALSAEGTHHARTDAPLNRPSGIPTPTTREAILDLFVERVADYRATVVRTTADGVADRIAAALGDVQSVVMPTGFDSSWVRGVAARWVDEDQVADVHELNDVDAVVSTASVGIATTGTIVLDHSDGQGRRGLTLLPDLHVCVVRADQVVADVPDAVARLRDSVSAGRPLTWISGPSATSDIELDRVEGVHGPRNLHVVVVE